MLYLALVTLAQTGLVAFLIHDRRAERREVAAERADLLQRIQAPHEAVMVHQRNAYVTPDPAPLEFDSDEDFHASREELAAALANSE